MFLRTRSNQSRRRIPRPSPLVATVNGGLQALADILLQPIVVLAAVAFLLGGSDEQIASFATVTVVAWTLSPLAVALIRRMTNRSDLVVLGAAVIRLAAVLVIGFAALRADEISTSRFLGLLVGAFIVYQAGTALASQATTGGPGQATHRGTARRSFRNRRIVAVVAAIVAAGVVWNVFRSDLTFQRAIEQVLVLATLAAVSATWFLLLLPGGRATTPRESTGGSIRNALGSFRVAAFRRFAGYKVLLAIAAAVDPFLIVFGFRELNLEVECIGIALLSFAAGHAAGAFAWPRWIARSGARIPFQLAALLRFALLLWVVAIPGILSSSLYTDRFDDGTAAMRGFAVGFVLLGLAGSVGAAANQRYLMSLTRPSALPGTTMAMNVLMALCGFGPLVVARLLGNFDLERILWGGAVCAALALFASGLLVESTVRVRTPVGTWRSTRQATNGA